jgi:hypothetical protein
VNEHDRWSGEPLRTPELIADAEARLEAFEFGVCREVMDLVLGDLLEIFETDEDLLGLRR